MEAVAVELRLMKPGVALWDGLGGGGDAGRTNRGHAIEVGLCPEWNADFVQAPNGTRRSPKPTSKPSLNSPGGRSLTALRDAHLHFKM